MYCGQCGNRIDNETEICPFCGSRVARPPRQPAGAQNTGNTWGQTGYGNTSNSVSSGENAAFWILGFFIPLAGLIIYLVYENSNPQRAKSAGKGALIGFIVGVVLTVVLPVVLTVLSIVFTFALTTGTFAVIAELY